MSEYTRSQFNDLLRKQGKEIGILPVQNVPNEQIRLEEVQRLGILDRDFSSTSQYHSLTQLATILTETQVSMINVLGSNVQRCKIDFGFDAAQSAMAQELPREISVCQYSLATPQEPLIIEDLFLDERTKNFQKLEAYSNLRFYAGLPLVTSRGYSIGTLCVIGTKPQKIDHDKMEGLRILADQVINLIEAEHKNHTDAHLGESSKSDSSGEDVRYFSTSSILFADFVGFTKLVEQLEPGDLIEILRTFFKGFDKLASKRKVRKVKTIGDCYMCVSGIPGQEKEHARNLCLFAMDMLQFVQGINMQHQVLERPIWKLRVGIHSGPLIANLRQDAFDVWGDSVNVAARMESSGEAGKVHISEKTAAYLGENAVLDARTEVELKNKGTYETYFLNGLT